MRTKESQEMYLETILHLKNKNKRVKSVNVAEELGYSRASVSRGIHLLINSNYITMNKDGVIEFTDEGYKLACSISERHKILTLALTMLGVDIEEAEKNACRIEHVISDKVFNQIKIYIEKYKRK